MTWRSVVTNETVQRRLSSRLHKNGSKCRDWKSLKQLTHLPDQKRDTLSGGVMKKGMKSEKVTPDIGLYVRGQSSRLYTNLTVMYKDWNMETLLNNISTFKQCRILIQWSSVSKGNWEALRTLSLKMTSTSRFSTAFNP